MLFEECSLHCWVNPKVYVLPAQYCHKKTDCLILPFCSLSISQSLSLSFFFSLSLSLFSLLSALFITLSLSLSLSLFLSISFSFLFSLPFSLSYLQNRIVLNYQFRTMLSFLSCLCAFSLPASHTHKLQKFRTFCLSWSPWESKVLSVCATQKFKALENLAVFFFLETTFVKLLFRWKNGQKMLELQNAIVFFGK